MIVNPVVFGKSGVKTVEVTFTSLGKNSLAWVGVDGTAQTKTVSSTGNYTISTIAGGLVVSKNSLSILSGNATQVATSPAQIYQANA